MSTTQYHCGELHRRQAVIENGTLNGIDFLEIATLDQFKLRIGFFLPVSALDYVSADPVTAGCRMIKSPAEIALMQKANDMTLAAYKAGLATLHEGMTQGDLQRMKEMVQALNLRRQRGQAEPAQVQRARALPCFLRDAVSRDRQRLVCCRHAAQDGTKFALPSSAALLQPRAGLRCREALS